MARIRRQDGTTHDLREDRPTIAGSGEGADLRLEGPGIAPRHCAFRPLKSGGLGIESLDPARRVRLNDRPVKAARLKDGDLLEIGDISFRFEAEQTPASSRDEADLPEGTELDGYRIEGVMGHGGMGTVYRATQLSLHREVALKVLRKDLSEDPSFVKRFVSEARAAARFNHPNVVQVFDVSEHEGRPFYSMELLTEGTLEDELRAKGRLSEEEVVRVLCDAARGLAYAEEIGLVHRDLKPENLMRTSQGTTKICDLGLAADPRGGTGTGLVGTPHFMSPEQCRKQPLDIRSDLYALGCSGYRLLTGKSPFTGRKVRDILKAHLEDPVPSAKALVPEIRDEVDRLLQRLMAKDPGDRPSSAKEVLAELESLRVARHSKALVLGLAGAVLLLVGGLVYLLGRAPETEVRTVREKDPRAAELERRNRELRARQALLLVAKDLPNEERARRLESVAKKFAGTKAAREATALSKRLREEATREAERAAARRARLDRKRERIRSLAEQARAEGRFDGVWPKLLEVADRDRDALVADLAKARTLLLASWRERVLAELQDLATRCEAEGLSPDALRKLREACAKSAEALKLPVPGEGPKTLGDLRTRFRRIAERAARRAEEVERRLAKERRERRDHLLFGAKGVLATCAAGSLDAARKALAGAEGLPALANLRALLDLAAGGSSSRESARSLLRALGLLLPPLHARLQNPASLPPSNLPGGIPVPEAASLPAELRPEAEALRTFLMLHEAWKAGRDAAVSALIQRLETRFRSTLVGMALGLDPS